MPLQPLELIQRYVRAFFSIEHDVAFSTKPFSEVLRSRAIVDFTPNLQTRPDGSVYNSATGETLYDASKTVVSPIEGVTIDLETNEITVDENSETSLAVPEENTINVKRRPGR